MRVLFEIRAVDRLRLGWTAHLEQRGPEPVAGAERQRLRLVPDERVFDRDRPLEGGKRGRLALVAESDLSFEDAGKHAEKFLRGIRAEESRRRVRGLQHRREMCFRGFAVARPELRVALSKLPDGADSAPGVFVFMSSGCPQRPNLICARRM